MGTSIDLGSKVRATLLGKTLLGAMLLLAGAVDVHAAAGDLDPTFGSGGIALANQVPPPDSFGAGLAPVLDADGRIVVAGASTEGVPGAGVGMLVRFTPGGALDLGFSGDGQLTTFTLVLSAVTVDSDGKLVVAGTDFPIGLEEFTLYRFSSDGLPDPSFGGFGSILHHVPESYIIARGVVVQGDGKPIVATRFVLSRFEADGDVDMGFASDGDLELAIEIAGGALYGSGPVVALQPDDKIVVVGVSGSDVAVARYEEDGDIDLTFGTGGVALADFGGTLDRGLMVAIQAGGAIVVAGSTNAGGEEDFAVARFDSGGLLDPGFSGDGLHTIDFGGDDDATYGLRVEADGTITVLGYTDSDVAAARLLSDGSPDPSFGTGGTLVIDPPITGYGGLIQPDGKLVIVGGQGNRLAAARFLADDCTDGILDPGEDCDEGAANGTSSSCCTSACEFRAAAEPCRPASSSCDVGDSCTGSDGTCPADAFVPDGTSCDDGDGCTTGDECFAGACTGDLEPAACLDSLLCYGAKVTRRTPRFSAVKGIDLADGFSSGAVDARKPRGLCTPASIDGGGSLAPDVHAVSYKIRKSAGEPKYVKQFGITVVDAFATLTLDALKAERLLAPAGLVQGGPAPTPAPGMLDHFRCHKVRTSPGSSFPDGIQVAVEDGFYSRVYEVESPRRLCLAAAKDGTPAVHPSAHLMCYRVALAPGEAPVAAIAGSIHTADSLGALRLDVTREGELCVPARLLP